MQDIQQDLHDHVEEDWRGCTTLEDTYTIMKDIRLEVADLNLCIQEIVVCMKQGANTMRNVITL